MKTFWTSALKDNPKYLMDKVPIFLTDDHEVIDAPSYWILSLIKNSLKSTEKLSTSPETIREYAWIIHRFLSWLDKASDTMGNSMGASNWFLAEEGLIYEYARYLLRPVGDKKPPRMKTIKYYLGRLQDFYIWATGAGYEHHWNINMKMKSFHLPNSGLRGSNINYVPAAIKVGPDPMDEIENDRDKLVTREQLPEAIKILKDDDFVYVIISAIIAATGLRPKDLFQLPYRGNKNGKNAGLMPYVTGGDKIPDRINYTFESKGKMRSIQFPGSVWGMVCSLWMQVRNKRANLYAKNNDDTFPSNDVLFLSKAGEIVSYDMMRKHFREVAKDKNYPGYRYTARMLRHHYATYFVYDCLQTSGKVSDSRYQPHIDEALRQMMGHADIGTTYKYYVDLCQVIGFEGSVDDVLKQADAAVHALEAIVKGV